MRECDRVTIEELGLPGIALMETAGRAAAAATLQLLDTPGRSRAGIFCGKGNNGGDGFVIARILANHGHLVDVYLLGESDSASGDAAVNLRFLEAICAEDLTPGRVTLHRFGDALGTGTSMAELLRTIAPHDVIVDALLGTGLTGGVRAPYDQLIAHINASTATVLAVDVPSGLQSDTGQPLGHCVEAHWTVALGLGKRGQFLDPGRGLCGRLEVAEIGIPDGVFDRAEVRGLALTKDSVRPFLPVRPRDGHKGTFGHVLAIGGADGMTGALTLCSAASLRAGAGLCTAMGPDSEVTDVTRTQPEIMTRRGNAEALREAAQQKTIAAGPGLGTSDEARALVMALIPLPRPRILDADALNLIAAAQDGNSILRTAAEAAPVVLTPHPGEFARLTGCPTPQVLADPVEHALAFAADTSCVVVLKSAATVVAHPDGRYAINTSGNPGMATGGSGDVLTGVIAGLSAQGADAWQAACLGVFVHGLAGDLAAGRRGQRAMTAGDIIDHLGEAMERCEQ